MTKKSAEEKIQCVLEHIKEQYDLSPKGSFTVMTGHTGHSYTAGEIRIYSQQFTLSCEVNHTEIQKILGKLQEDGLIERFSIVSEYA